ncbi:anthrax toxin receptor-like [Manis pentadactyla]|uniref:anthrax toxin receptor-like n=1 Tax=Manis pentadactyla TaxID=143292 RepID=UPI00255CF631|nr:anthrax toxin receptor-like [Manis pentadactyla]
MASALFQNFDENSVSWMLGPMYAIFLLLLLPSPLLTTRSTPDPSVTQDQGHHPSSRLQESPADGESCWSTYDLYFVLDSSRSVNDNWEFTQSFVRDLVHRFKNPKQRMSFITYSTHGRIHMKLTSNRKIINNALVELLNVRPSGAINMQHGLKKANEQIERTRAAGAKVPSLIIVLTGEQLLAESFAETQVEAAKSKQLGATLYFVGVQNYQLSQLLEIAGEEDHLFQVDSGYPGLEDIVDPLILSSCVQITSVDFSAICTRDRNEVKVFGKGFKNIQKDEVVCRFRLGKETARIEALSVQDTSITCPGPKLNNQHQAVFIDISLNNGLSFIKTDFDVSRRNCVTSWERTPPALLDAVSPAAQRHALPPAVLGDIRHVYLDEKSYSPVLSFKPLYWAVPLAVLPFLVLLCCCIGRWCTACIPASLGKKCLTVIMSCCNKDETTAQTGDSAVPLLTPVVDHPAAHSINPAAIAPSPAARAHGARVPNLPS